MGQIILPSLDLAPAVMLSQEAVNIRDDLELRAHEASKQAITVDNIEQINALWTEIDAFTKEVEKTRERVKKPAWDYGKQVDATAKEAVQNLDPLWKSLGVALAKFTKEENARREAEARRAREEALRLEREENARREAERAAEEQRLREQAELDTPPGEEPPEISLPVFDEPLSRPVAPVLTAPPLKTQAKGRTNKVLEIYNARLIPDQFNGIQLKKPDEKAILALLKMGTESNPIEIPGCRLVDDYGVQSKGR